MVTGSFYKISFTMAIGQLHNRLLSGSNARHFNTTVSQTDHQKTNYQLKSFNERIINYSYTTCIQEYLLEIAVCSLMMLKDYPQSLTNADVLGQGNLNLVSENSGKSQGILLSIICGNPGKELITILCSEILLKWSYEAVIHKCSFLWIVQSVKLFFLQMMLVIIYDRLFFGDHLRQVNNLGLGVI